jgi:hypothetical protein
MDAAALVTHVRNHYVEQFRRFANQQRSGCVQGASEVKLQLSETSQIFQRLYCVDFIKNDGQSEVIELQPEHVLTFDPIEGSFGAASLGIEYLRWDDVLFRHDLAVVPAESLTGWFRHWFDPDDERQEPNTETSNAIHSLLVQPNMLSIDFGTADPEAFWQILELLEGSGARTIRVSSSKAVPDAD